MAKAGTAGSAKADPDAAKAKSPRPRSPAARPDPLFDLRWTRGARDLIGPLTRLYGGAHDIPALMDRLRALLARHSADRPADLRALDLARDIDPDWFLSQDKVAYVFYIDRFAGTLRDLPARIPYLQDLGITYVHLMPCLKPRPGQSDGGYAVMDYRAINPALGTMADFEETARAFRAAGMDLCIDMVLNHTAKEHEWAERARAGDAAHQAFYRMFDDDTLPRQYEKDLVEIFPAQAPGNFTFYPDMGKWVWTTFNEYQWDLNWENPEVFLAILDTILHLANKGVTVFRLDAVAFMWKRMGTTCQNLPEVHDIIQALTQGTRVAAPAVIHKAEAIVAPRDLVPYLGTGRHEGRVANLAYHNNLMVQFWASLASRDTRLMTHILRTHFPENFRRACFATYIRCHDDIGWAITPEDTAPFAPMTDWGHREFLADFYNGTFPGSFARGADFQSNPDTGDRRTNGSLASLAGLESATTPEEENLAIARILLGHGLIAAFGGIPLFYMGDELGLLNDHAYLDDPDLADDGRWMHRPPMDWKAAATVAKGKTRAARIHAGTRAIIAARKSTPQLASHVPTRVLDMGDPHLFIFERPGDDRTVTCLFNFTESVQSITPWSLRLDPARPYIDRLTGAPLRLHEGGVTLPPYGQLWLMPD